MATGIVHSNLLVLDRLDSVSGGVRQLDLSRGDGSTLVGGLWVFLPVETLTGPRLMITRDPAGSTATVTWPSLSPGFILQQNVDLNTTSWGIRRELVRDDGINRSVVVNSAAGNSFYRLFRP